MAKPGYVYILTNASRSVLCTGVTSGLAGRMERHRAGTGSAFAARYNAKRMVYAEYHDDIEDAIRREKQIKAGSRANKVALIESVNPEWEDLSEKDGWMR